MTTETTFADRWGIHEQQFWLRGQRPDESVRYDETTRMWEVFGHEEALTILSDPATYSSNTTRLLPEVESFNEGNIVKLDPPLHNKLRKLVSHAFTPRVVAGLEPRIAELTHGLLDEVAGSDRIELVADLAYPLPVIVVTCSRSGSTGCSAPPSGSASVSATPSRNGSSARPSNRSGT